MSGTHFPPFSNLVSKPIELIAYGIRVHPHSSSMGRARESIIGCEKFNSLVTNIISAQHSFTRVPMEANFEKSPISLSCPESEKPSDFGLISPKRLVHFIAQHPADQKAWNEFFRRYHQHIGQTIYKAVKRYGHPDGLAIVEDLVQEVYKKLVADNCKALCVFKSDEENGIFKYLQIIAIRVVLNDSTKKKPKKFPLINKTNGDSEIDQLLPQDWRDKIRYDELVAEIETCLERILQGRRHANRDRLIIGYYLFDGLKPDEIVPITPLEVPSTPVDVSVKRVANIIGEILKKLRSCMEKTWKS